MVLLATIAVVAVVPTGARVATACPVAAAAISSVEGTLVVTAETSVDEAVFLHLCWTAATDRAAAITGWSGYLGTEPIAFWPWGRPPPSGTPASDQPPHW